VTMCARPNRFGRTTRVPQQTSVNSPPHDIAISLSDHLPLSCRASDELCSLVLHMHRIWRASTEKNSVSIRRIRPDE